MPMFSKILCPVDGSEASLKAVAAAANLARTYQARLTLLHVMPTPVLELLAYRPTMVKSKLLHKDVEDHLNQRADALLEQARQAAGTEAETLKVLGHPGEKIAELALEQGFDAIIMGCRGRGGLTSLLLGSVSAYVAGHATVPVMIVK